MVERPSANWRTPFCGGVSVHGLNGCSDDISEGPRCVCTTKPNNFNYQLHYMLAQAIKLENLHMDVNCSKWDDFAGKLFTTGSFNKYQQVIGGSLKIRFFNTMINEVSKRHGVGNYANGFETHPELTPYDILLLLMIQEREIAEEKKKLAAEKKARKFSSMLAHEDALCSPVSSVAKPASLGIDEDGEILEISEKPSSSSDVPADNQKPFLVELREYRRPFFGGIKRIAVTHQRGDPTRGRSYPPERRASQTPG